MRRQKQTILTGLLVCSMVFCHVCLSEAVSESQIQMAATNWIAGNAVFQSLKSTVSVEKIIPLEDELTGVLLKPHGCLVMTSDTDLPPVVFFSTKGGILDECLYSAWIPVFRRQTELFRTRQYDKEIQASNAGRWASLLAEPSELEDVAKQVWVPHFVKTHWGQWTPFNDEFPEFSTCAEQSIKAPTGCSTTAVAQLMNYYGWPHQGKGCKTLVDNDMNLSLTSDFSEMIEWTKMDGATNDVSRLMLKLAMLGDARFKSFSTKVSMAGLAEGIHQHLGYELAEMMLWRNGLRERLKAEIQKKHPVAVVLEKKNGSTHAVVADGYFHDGCQEFVHLNYGWYGEGDGYLVMDSLSAILYGYIGMVPRPSPMFESMAERQGTKFELRWSFPACYMAEAFRLTASREGKDYTTVADGIAGDSRSICLSGQSLGRVAFRLAALVDGEWQAASDEISVWVVSDEDIALQQLGLTEDSDEKEHNACLGMGQTNGDAVNSQVIETIHLRSGWNKISISLQLDAESQALLAKKHCFLYDGVSNCYIVPKAGGFVPGNYYIYSSKADEIVIAGNP